MGPVLSAAEGMIPRLKPLLQLVLVFKQFS
jgi:hypothetical protein